MNAGPVIRMGLLIVLVPVAAALAGAQPESGTMQDPRTSEAIALMNDFAERSGLDSGQPRQRYLWTDAFAVCNFLGLARLTGKARYQALALQLVDQVHTTLGQHRDDDPRTGWLSGLSARAGALHPTRGGLRIGKALPERRPDEPVDERMEWDRDGQYFHYLTRWMHALDQVTRATDRSEFNTWARELDAAAFAAFTYQPAAAQGIRRMYWKMSIDLSRPQVSSMGQHDPLDGYITTLQLRSSAAALPEATPEPALDTETREYAAMLRPAEWATPDPLGIGGLLIDAQRVAQLLQEGVLSDTQLLESLLGAAHTGLQYYAQSGELRQPAENRLAFRELGLAIGLHAVERIWQAASSGAGQHLPSREVRTRLRALSQYLPMRDQIESFWRSPDHQDTWTEHRNINTVMLATSLVPDGFLLLRSPGSD